MTFFESVRPIIDWKLRSVVVQCGKKRVPLPVLGVDASNSRVVEKSRPCATTITTNSFAVLKTFDENCIDDDVEINNCAPLSSPQTSNSVVALPIVNKQARKLASAKSENRVQKCCKSCEKSNFGVSEQCSRCANHSF